MTYWRRVAAALFALSVLANIVTGALLWWLVVEDLRHPTPAFTLDPLMSSETTVTWDANRYILRTTPRKP